MAEKEKTVSAVRWIKARVIDEKDGIKTFEHVRAIRIKSPGSNLVIMLDYTPLLGKIIGDITFLTEDDEIRYSGVDGYYKHLRNEFTLLIRENGYSIGG